MNKTIRVVVALIVTSLLTTTSVADDKVLTVSNAGCAYEVFPENPPNDGILFVDHSPTGRSGHLGHALVEYEDGKILAFYPSCSSDSHNPNKPASKGHSAVGWMEYKRSEDGGKTWSAPQVLAYSKDLFDAGQKGGPDAKKYSAFAEKAVLTEDGRIVVFFLVCDITTNVIWRQFQIPRTSSAPMADTHGVSLLNFAPIEVGSTMQSTTTERYSRSTSRTTMRSISWGTSPRMCTNCTLAATAVRHSRSAASFPSTPWANRTGPCTCSSPEA